MEEKTEKIWNTELKANTKNLKVWSIIWVLATAFATFGPIFIWDKNQLLTVLGVAINLGCGAGMILANRKFINSLDELQKKIQMDAMGIALGVGVVVGLGYSILDQTDVITQDAQISFLVVLISLTYMISLSIGKKRYK